MNFCREVFILSRETHDLCRELLTLSRETFIVRREFLNIRRELFALCRELGVTPEEFGATAPEVGVPRRNLESSPGGWNVIAGAWSRRQDPEVPPEEVALDPPDR